MKLKRAIFEIHVRIYTVCLCSLYVWRDVCAHHTLMFIWCRYFTPNVCERKEREWKWDRQIEREKTAIVQCTRPLHIFSLSLSRCVSISVRAHMYMWRRSYTLFRPTGMILAFLISIWVVYWMYSCMKYVRFSVKRNKCINKM